MRLRLCRLPPLRHHIGARAYGLLRPLWAAAGLAQLWARQDRPRGRSLKIAARKGAGGPMSRPAYVERRTKSAPRQLAAGRSTCQKSLAEFRARRHEIESSHFLRRHVRRRKYFSARKCANRPPQADGAFAQRAASPLSENPAGVFRQSQLSLWESWHGAAVTERVPPTGQLSST